MVAQLLLMAIHRVRLVRLSTDDMVGFVRTTMGLSPPKGRPATPWLLKLSPVPLTSILWPCGPNMGRMTCRKISDHDRRRWWHLLAAGIPACAMPLAVMRVVQGGR